jgi:hypothetical protein
MFRNRRSRGPRRAYLLTLASLSLSLPLASRALAAAVTWTSPSNDSWNDPASWSSSPSLPGLADDVLISQPSPVTVTLDYGNQTVNSLTDNNTLTLTGGSLAVTTTLQVNGTFNLQGGTLQNTTVNSGLLANLNFNSGTLSNVSINGTLPQSSNSSIVNFAGTTLNNVTISENFAILAGVVSTLNNVALSGNVSLARYASVILDSNITNNSSWTSAGNNGLTIGTTVTIGGSGSISLASSTIAAAAKSASLTIGQNQTLEGGFTVFNNVQITNKGTIIANTPASATMIAGTFYAGNNSLLESANGATLVLNNVTLNNSNATLIAVASANATPSVINMYQGSVSGGLISTDAFSQITLYSSSLSNLSAAGNFVLPNGTDYLSNVALTGNLSLNNGSLINVSGVTNSANWSALSNASVNVNGPFTNTGTIEPLAGASLQLSGGSGASFNNTNGTLAAMGSLNGLANGTPSRLSIANLTIIGGQLTTDALGQIQLQSNANLSNVTVNGNLQLNSSSTLSNDIFYGNITQSTNITLAGTITNNANWTLSTTSCLTSSGPVTLAGVGSISFPSDTLALSGPLTVVGVQTLRGSGSIQPSAAFTNNGTLDVDGLSNSISLRSGNISITNNGLLESTNGANLILSSIDYAPATVLNNTNGILSANGNGSELSIAYLTITGGQLSTDASGQISLGPNTFVSNTTVTGNIQISGSATFTNDTLNGTITVNPGDFVSLAGVIINNAVLSENYGQVVGFADGTILNGTGTINFGGGLIIPLTGIASLSIGPAQTLSGNATITNYLINNAGTIAASSSTFFGNITIDSPAGTFVNTGLIEATSGNSLYLNGVSSSSFLNNSNGTLGAYGTSSIYKSTLNVSNITVSGGQLLTNAFGSIGLSQSSLINASVSGNLNAGYAVLFSNDTFAGTVSIGGPITLSGTLINNANWPAFFGAPEPITLAGNVTINGNGTIGLDGAVVSSANGTLATLTIGPNQTIQGSSNSTFSSSLTVINTGTIATATPFSNSIIFNGPFTNAGFVDVNSVGSISFSSLTNLSNGILTGGTWEVATFGILTAPGPITTNAATIILNNSSANGTSLANLTLNQANLTLTNASRFSAAANFTNTGNLTIGSFSTFSAPQLLLNAGTLAGTGTIAAPVLAGSSPNTIHPGIPASLTPGTLTLQSLSTNPNTTLAFNLLTPASSTSPSVNDRLVISSPNGLTFNGGSLQLTSAPTGPAALGYYQLIQYTGSFTGLSSLLLPTSTNNLVYSLDTARDPNSIDLHIGLLGDANDDGKVDLSDLNTLLNNLGSPTASWTAGNFDGNPTIDLTDLNDVLNNLGTTYTTPSTAAAPEPASLLIALPLATLLIARRKTVAAAT